MLLDGNQGDMESHQHTARFARLLVLIRPYQAFLPGLYDSYGAVSLIYKQLSLMQRQMTRCGILALMFACAKPSMTSNKLVLFQMHEMMRKLQTVLGHFFPLTLSLCLSFTLSRSLALLLSLICSPADALSPRKDQAPNSVFILPVARKHGYACLSMRAQNILCY